MSKTPVWGLLLPVPVLSPKKNGSRSVGLIIEIIVKVKSGIKKSETPFLQRSGRTSFGPLNIFRTKRNMLLKTEST